MKLVKEHRQKTVGLIAFAGEQPVKLGVRRAVRESISRPHATGKANEPQWVLSMMVSPENNSYYAPAG